MEVVSPVVADAFRLLHRDLYGHLDMAEFLANKVDRWHRDDVEAARKLIPDLVVVIRGLLVEHEPQPDGQCLLCSSAWPCTVVATIHALVKDPDREFVAILRRANDQ